MMDGTWMSSKVQIMQSYSSRCSVALTEGGTYLRSEETEVTNVSSVATRTPSIALHHIIIHLSCQTQKYLPVMNRQINAFLSLGGIGLPVISAVE